MGCGCNLRYSYPPPRDESEPASELEPDPDTGSGVDPGSGTGTVCPAGQMPSRSGGCLQPMQCAPGEVWDEATQECVPSGCSGGQVLDEFGVCQDPQKFSNGAALPCPKGEVWDESLKGCVLRCADDEVSVMDRCVKRILCASDEVANYTSGVGVCDKRQKCEGGGSENFQTGEIVTWTGYIDDNGDCIREIEPCKPGQEDLGEGKCRWPPCPAGYVRYGESDCKIPSAVDGDPCPDTEQEKDRDGVCRDKDWVGWATERPFPNDLEDEWIGNMSGIPICMSNVLLMPPTLVSMDGTKIRWPNGRIEYEELVCNKLGSQTRVPCEKFSDQDFLSSDNSGINWVFHKVGLPPLPSLDRSICNKDKLTVIDGVIRFLDSYSGTSSDDISVLNDGFQIGDVPPEMPGGNFADYATAAVQFGAGNFGESVINLLEAIPGFGNYLGDGVEMLGLGNLLRRVLNDKLSPEQKDNVIDFVLEGLATASSVPNPASPIMIPLLALIQAFIKFGHRDWDEALMTMVTLGMNKVVEKLGGAGKIYHDLFDPKDFSKVLDKGFFGKLFDKIASFFSPVFDRIRPLAIEAAKRLGVLDSLTRLTESGKREVGNIMLYYNAYGLLDNFPGGSEWPDN